MYQPPKDFERRKKAVWEELEKEYDFPVAEKIRNYLEVEEVGAPRDYIDGDPEGEDVYLESLKSVVRRYFTFLELFELKVKPSNGEPPRRKEIRRKWFERRLYLVNFVLDKGLNPKTRRIDWKRITTEWNTANPSDTISLPTLKNEYYHALKDEPLMAQFFILGLIDSIKFYSQDLQDRQDGWAAVPFDQWSMEFFKKDFWKGVRDILPLLDRISDSGRPFPLSLKQALNDLNVYTNVIGQWLKQPKGGKP